MAVYSKAVYLTMDGRILALTTSAVPSGPIHVRCDTVPPARHGEPVIARDEVLRSPAWQCRLTAPVWRPALPEPGAFTAEACLVALEPAEPAHLLVGPLPEAWPRYADVLGQGDLMRAAETLGGRGAGLTPAGDDVLAGLLLVARTRWGAAAEDELVRVAARARTNDIASAFLHWAARGQSISPVHQLFQAENPAAARAAATRLRAFGGSSGKDLAYGLILGLRHLASRVTGGRA